MGGFVKSYKISKEELYKILQQEDFYISSTAKVLGIGRVKLSNMIRFYDLDIPHRTGVRSKYKYNCPYLTNVYHKILSRCYNPRNKNYDRYGERGIKMYQPWFEDRDLFQEYCMTLENYLKPFYTLDRIDNDKGYEPGNLRFASKKEQSNNQSRNKMVTYKGEMMTLSQLCEKYSLKYDRVQDRLELGWTVEEAVELPKFPKRRK